MAQLDGDDDGASHEVPAPVRIGLGEAISALERAIVAGRPALFPILRAVTSMHARFEARADDLYDPEYGYSDEALLGMIGALGSLIAKVAEVATDPSVALRSRGLLADLISIEIDGNLQNRADYLRDLQREARSLLTGESDPK